MKLFPVDIRGKSFKVAMADSESSRHKGLSGLARLAPNRGMLFVYPEKTRMYMVMRDMNFGLDFLFLDENFEIVQLGTMEADDTRGLVALTPCVMVLELPKGTIKELQLSTDMRIEPSAHLHTHSKGVSKFKRGGRFEMIGDKVYRIKVDDVKPEEGRLQILNEDGEVVANIDSGSRIFSREHTKELIKLHKGGDITALAQSMIKILDIQDSQKQEHVDG
jgi:uncharacterized membrane protein (UPF0127 family)